MAWLIRLIGARLRRDEQGAVAVIVAVLIGGGVLTGMGALVIDVGQLYQEQGELQSGADAGALGVAKSCALGSCAPGVAAQLADANASSLTGGSAGVPLVCGSSGLEGCPPSTGTLTDCPSAPAGVNFVEVHTATLTASGSTLLPPAFAQTLLGNSSYQGTNVQACAIAEWGPPAAATTVALAISACEWDQATQQGSSFPPGPPYSEDPLPAPSFDQVLTVSTGNGTGCAPESPGADGAGAFGWTTDQTGNCALAVSAPSFPGGSGPAASEACEAVLQNAQQQQVPILVPVYQSFDSGANTFDLKGFAEFVVTGYNLAPGFFAPDWLDPANTCSGTNYCLTGYFVEGVIPATGTIGGPMLGASILDLTG